MLKIIASFVVGFLFVMHALGDFTAHADNQGIYAYLENLCDSLVNLVPSNPFICENY